jgi:MFS family permease
MFGIASIVGPILGGVFTDRLTWRWCFWINLPFGALTIITVAGFFKNPKRDFSHISFKQKVQEMDLIGASFLIGSIVCLLLALQWGGTIHPWKSSKVWGNLLGFGLFVIYSCRQKSRLISSSLLIVFIAIQIKKGDSATIPIRIMKNRTIIACALVLSLLSMGIYR